MALNLDDVQDKISVFERAGSGIFEKLDELVQKNCIYKHQAEAVKAIKMEFDNPPEGYENLRNVSLAVLPTGTGKTGVGVLAAYARRAHRVLIITPSVEISKQQLTQFMPVCDKKINPLPDENRPFFIQRGIVKDSKDTNYVEKWAPLSGVCVLKTTELEVAKSKGCELVISNAHKFGSGDGKRGVDIGTFPQDYFTLVIVDEAHHYPAPTWKNIVHHFREKAKILFLTATPYNGKDHILSLPSGKEKKPCYELERTKAVKDGVIREMAFLNSAILTDEHKFELKCEDLSALLDQLNEISALDPPRFNEILIVLMNVKTTLKKHDEKDKKYSHKAMVLAKSISEAQAIAKMWNKIIKFGECKTFTQEDHESENLNAFKTKKETKVLVVIRRLTEGFDCKNVSVAAILRNVQPQSRVYFAQFVGRAVRKLHKDDPVKATVISHPVHNQKQNFDTFEKLAEKDPEEDLEEDPKEDKQNDLEELPQVPPEMGQDLEELPED